MAKILSTVLLRHAGPRGGNDLRSGWYAPSTLNIIFAPVSLYAKFADGLLKRSGPLALASDLFGWVSREPFRSHIVDPSCAGQ